MATSALLLSTFVKPKLGYKGRYAKRENGPGHFTCVRVAENHYLCECATRAPARSRGRVDHGSPSEEAHIRLLPPSFFCLLPSFFRPFCRLLTFQFPHVSTPSLFVRLVPNNLGSVLFQIPQLRKPLYFSYSTFRVLGSPTPTFASFQNRCFPTC